MRTLIVVFGMAAAALVGLSPAQASVVGCPAGQVPHIEYTDGTSVVTCVSESANHGGSGGGGSATCDTPWGSSCYDEFGNVWFAAFHCFAGPVDPSLVENLLALNEPLNQKPAGNAVLWECITGGGEELFWVLGGAVDPVALAQQAADQLPLPAPAIHLAPQPPLMTYVGLATWLWIPKAQWAPLTNTVTAGGTSVTVVATPSRLRWNLDAGADAYHEQLKDCGGPGLPWVKGMPGDSETYCSWTYTRVSDFEPDGVYPVRASLWYQVNWTCTGNCSLASGTLGEIDGPFTNTSLKVGERQSVVINTH